MDMNKLTQKTQAALVEAQQLAIENGHQDVDPEHILLALLRQDDGLIPRLFERMDVDPQAVDRKVADMLARKPKVSGSGYDSSRVGLSPKSARLLTGAEREAKRLKDEYTSVEHILIELLKDDDKSPLAKL